MRGIRYLIVEFDGVPRVHLSEGGAESVFPKENSLNQYRASPVFPVDPKVSTAPDLEGEGYIGFYFLTRAFSTIGRILTRIPENSRQGLWFSHGLASLIVFSKDYQILSDIRSYCGDVLRGFESWTVNGAAVSSKDAWLCPPQAIQREQFILPDFGDLEPDHRDVLIELQTCIMTAAARAAQYAPSQLLSYSRLTIAVSEIIDELRFLSNPGGSAPSSLPKNAIDFICSSPVERARRVHQRVGQLVQINSALSYIISQAYSGAIPILQNECRVSRFSLLGIGTAFLGLNAFSRSIESIFEKHPIDTVIAEKYAIAEGVDVFRSLQSFKPENWSLREDLALDALLEGQLPAAPNPKLTFFSGRVGFRESEFSVTAAIQALNAAGTAHWSLMTITHELLHAHVRGILGAIFADKQQRSPGIAFKDYYQRYKNVVDQPDKPKTLIESLRSIIYNYCRQSINIEAAIDGYHSHLNKTEEGQSPLIRTATVLPGESRIREELTKKYRELNEIMVHVLDHQYFYNGDNALYLRSIWTSWANVPAVLEQVEHYLLRSLVAIGAHETGTLPERFSLSVEIVSEALRSLIDGNVPVAEALRTLQDPKAFHRLRLEFLPGIYLAEMVMKFLRASCIASSLPGSDKNINSDGEEYKYVLEEGEFPGVDVESPHAFVLDRLRRVLRNEKSTLHRTHLAGWILLACASAAVS